MSNTLRKVGTLGNYTTDLDRLAEKLAPEVTAGDTADALAAHAAIEKIARDGHTCTYDRRLGGQAAAWAAMDRIIAAGGSASAQRANDHDPDAWILHVAGWLA